MLNYKISCGAIAIIMALLLSFTSTGYIEKAFAETTNITASSDNSTASSGNFTASSGSLEKPLYTERMKLVSNTIVNSSGESPGIQWSYKGDALISGTNTTDSGQLLITFGPPGTGLYKIPEYIRGEGALTSSDGQRADYIFQSIGYTAKPNQNTTYNGIIVFINQTPPIGKLSVLNTPSNTFQFSAEINRSGEGIINVWHWR